MSVDNRTCVSLPRAKHRVKNGGAPIKPVLLNVIHVPEKRAARSETLKRWGATNAQVLLTYRLRAADGWAVIPAYDPHCCVSSGCVGGWRRA